MVFSILYNDAVDSLFRTNPNYKVIDELVELRKLTRIHTPGEQKRCAILLSICSKILIETDFKIERSLKHNINSILETCFSRNKSHLNFVKDVFTSSCLHNIIRLFYEIDHVRCGSITMFHILRCFQHNAHRDFAHSVIFTNAILKLNPNINGNNLTLSDFITLIIDICTLRPFEFIKKIFGANCLHIKSLKDLKNILEMKNQLNFASPCDTLLANWCERVIFGGAAGIIGSTNNKHLFEVIDNFPLYFISIFYIQRRFQMKSGVKYEVWQKLTKIRCKFSTNAHKKEKAANRSCHKYVTHAFKHYRVNRWLHSINVNEQKKKSKKDAFHHLDVYKLYNSKEVFVVVRGKVRGILNTWGEVEDSIYGLSDTLYFQCSTTAIAEKKLKMWSRRKRKKGWRTLYDKD